ncbi:hypothetical protein [Austwickia chelonae]|uniref:hypothetical protein n=1 Tax=Austwickia chelonae TaxID=100225 RepID=UPI001F07EEA6|nr:hypothetical protein [Austwickia chelonae]
MIRISRPETFAASASRAWVAPHWAGCPSCPVSGASMPRSRTRRVPVVERMSRVSPSMTVATWLVFVAAVFVPVQGGVQPVSRRLVAMIAANPLL